MKRLGFGGSSKKIYRIQKPKISHTNPQNKQKERVHCDLQNEFTFLWRVCNKNKSVGV